MRRARSAPWALSTDSRRLSLIYIPGGGGVMLRSIRAAAGSVTVVDILGVVELAQAAPGPERPLLEARQGPMLRYR